MVNKLMIVVMLAACCIFEGADCSRVAEAASAQNLRVTVEDLNQAIKDGDIDNFENLYGIACNRDKNIEVIAERAANGETPIVLAIQSGDIELINGILSELASFYLPDASIWEEAAIAAIRRGNPEIVEKVFDAEELLSPVDVDLEKLNQELERLERYEADDLARIQQILKDFSAKKESLE